MNAVCLMRSLLAPQFLRSVSQMKCVTLGVSLALMWQIPTPSHHITCHLPREACAIFLRMAPMPSVLSGLPLLSLANLNLLITFFC